MKKIFSIILSALIISSLIAVSGDELSFSPDKTLGGKIFRIIHTSTQKVVSVANSALTDGARINLQDEQDDEIMDWLFIPQGVGQYTVINKKSNKAFDIPGISTDAGKELTQYTINYGNNQIFELQKTQSGNYLFKCKHSNLYLTVKDGYLYQEEFKGDSSQIFTLKEVGKSEYKLFAVGVTPFVIKGEDNVTNAKIQWYPINGATKYEVYRSTNGNEYELINTLTGTSMDDYDLVIGYKYTYKVKAYIEDQLIDEAESNLIIPYELPGDLKISSNIVSSGLKKPNQFYIDGVYYRFSTKGRTDGVGGFGSLVCQTSTDDIVYGNEFEVLNFQDIVSHPTCSDIKEAGFESQNFLYNKETNEFVFIAHMEAGGGYGFARTAFAAGKVGERFKFYGAHRLPAEGNQGDTRDLSVFVDDDNQAYLIAAVNVNADLAIYRLTPDWHGVDKFLCFGARGSHRELPSILKHEGLYYLFTSGTAGWYPTQGMFNTATSMEGPWSELRRVGNTTTFSAQSGSVSRLNKKGNNFLMTTYRWMYFWQDATNRYTMNRRHQIILHDGYAFYDFFNEILYDYDRDILVSSQNGRLLSQGKKITTSSNQESAYLLNDGDYQTRWTGENKWPFEITIDLEKEHELTELQISWLIYNGSEAYYQYKVEGSSDGVNYTTLLDRTQEYTDYGFTVDQLSGKARYVKITVVNAKPRNSQTNTYTPQVFEVKVFGK